MGGPKVHKVPGGRAQGSQATCDVLRIAIDLKLGYCGIVRRRDAETQVQVHGTGLTLYQGRTTSGCKNRKDKMAKKELKPEYQPGGAKRQYIIDKAVKYLKEYPGLQSDKKFFLLDKVGLTTTEYLEALNRASNGELVKTALGD